MTMNENETIADRIVNLDRQYDNGVITKTERDAKKLELTIDALALPEGMKSDDEGSSPVDWDLSEADQHTCRRCGTHPDTQEKAGDWEYGRGLCGPCFTIENPAIEVVIQINGQAEVLDTLSPDFRLTGVQPDSVGYWLQEIVGRAIAQSIIDEESGNPPR